TRQLKYSFLAFPAAFHGGVRVAVGDVTGDGNSDIIAGTGPGGGARVRLFDGRDGSLLGSFQPFTAAITDGVFVAAGARNGDGKADIIVGTDQGSSGQVKLFSGATGTLLASWSTDLGSGGVRVAAGDVNGDGKADVIAAAGPGGQPWVSVFDAVTHAPIYTFLAFDPTYRGGVFVS